MFERKLVVGRYISLTVDFHVPPPANSLGEFQSVELKSLYLQQSVRSWNKRGSLATERTDDLMQPKLHRRFNWLPYSPGIITQTPLDREDVLSGNFSGC
jgi:hypothetical protein